jgi:hypothetical protein
MGMIMRTPPDMATIDEEKFISGVHNNMDESDSVEKIVPVCERACVRACVCARAYVSCECE